MTELFEFEALSSSTFSYFVSDSSSGLSLFSVKVFVSDHVATLLFSDNTSTQSLPPTPRCFAFIGRLIAVLWCKNAAKKASKLKPQQRKLAASGVWDKAEIWFRISPLYKLLISCTVTGCNFCCRIHNESETRAAR